MTDGGRVEVQRFPHDVFMIREADHREDVAIYVVSGTREAAVIDTGLGLVDLREVVARLTPRRPVVLQTHLHWDHIGGSQHFDDVRAHRAELTVRRVGWPWVPPDETASNGGIAGETGRPGSEGSAAGAELSWSGSLSHGDVLDLGGRSLEVVHTPGHSPGSLSFLDHDARILFCGDLCYLGQMLLFVSASDLAAFRQSLHALATIVVDVSAIYPAHGSAPLSGADVLAMRDAFELVWNGKKPEWHGSYAGHRVAIHDFGRFGFLLPPE